MSDYSSSAVPVTWTTNGTSAIPVTWTTNGTSAIDTTVSPDFVTHGTVDPRTGEWIQAPSPPADAQPNPEYKGDFSWKNPPWNPEEPRPKGFFRDWLQRRGESETRSDEGRGRGVASEGVGGGLGQESVKEMSPFERAVEAFERVARVGLTPS